MPATHRRLPLRLPLPLALVLTSALCAPGCLTVEPDKPRPVIDVEPAFHLCTVCVPAFSTMVCCDPRVLRCPSCSFATRENDEGIALCCQTEAVVCGRCRNPMRVSRCCQPDPAWIAQRRAELAAAGG